MQTKIYREQHGRLRQILREMAAMDGSGSDDLDIRRALGRLTGTVKIHLAGEDEGLYPRLLAHPDAAVRAKAREFQESMGGLAAAYVAFAEKWTNAALMRDDRAGFFRELDGIIDALTKRMDLEDRELYAMADRELAQSA